MLRILDLGTVVISVPPTFVFTFGMNSPRCSVRGAYGCSLVAAVTGSKYRAGTCCVPLHLCSHAAFAVACTWYSSMIPIDIVLQQPSELYLCFVVFVCLVCVFCLQ